MTAKAGQLRHRVALQKLTAGGRDENGFELPASWTVSRKIWAKVTHLSSRDLLTASADKSEVVARMVTRYTNDIDTTTRIMWKNRIYNVVGEAIDDNSDGMTYQTYNLSRGLEAE